VTTPVPRDIETRADIEVLVNAFYTRVRADELLGPIFDGVARVDWDEHLPKMYDFWELVLFGSSRFKGNPLAAHRALARQTPLGGREFGRWIELFHTTVDELFAGAVADEARLRALRIAAVMQHHITEDALTAST
jgi:hemoglobin